METLDQTDESPLLISPHYGESSTGKYFPVLNENESEGNFRSPPFLMQAASICTISVENHCKQLIKDIISCEFPKLEFDCQEHAKDVCEFIPREIGYTILHVAILRKNLTILEDVISKFGFDLDLNQKSTSAKNPGACALHLAAQENFSEAISLLLALRAEIDLEDDWGLTPLQQGAFHRSTEAVKCLIENGAQLNTLVPKRFAIDLSTLALVLKKTPRASDAIKSRLDKSIKFEEDENNGVINLKFSFASWEIDDIHLIHDFANEDKNSTLMEHPLVRRMLDENWRAVTKIFYARLAFALCIFTFVTAFIFSEKRWLIAFLAPLVFIEWLRKAASIASYVITPGAAVDLKALKGYVFNIVSICQSFCIYGIIVFCLSNDENHIKMIGPLVFLSCWIDCTVLIGEFPIFGLQLEMYYSVLKQFFSLFAAFGIFMIGFFVCFYMYFKEEQLFSTWYFAATKLLMMFVGEFDYNDLIGHYTDNTTDSNLRGNSLGSYRLYPLICISMFAVAVTIVLMSLLIGQVVEVDDIRSQALSQKLRSRAAKIKFYICSWNAIKFLAKKCARACCKRGETQQLHFTRRALFKTNVSHQSCVPYVPLSDAVYPEYYHRAYEIASANYKQFVPNKLLLREGFMELLAESNDSSAIDINSFA